MSRPVDFMSCSVDFVSHSVDFVSHSVDFRTVLSASLEWRDLDATHDKSSRYGKTTRNETAIFDLEESF